MPAYDSYAALFLAHPTFMESLRSHYGSDVYTDDATVCDPNRDPQAIAVVRYIDHGSRGEILVYDLPAAQDDEPAFTYTFNA